MASMGTQHKAKDFANPNPEPESLEFPDRPRPSVGDVYMRPLALERTASSLPSTETSTPRVTESVEPEAYTNRASGYFGHLAVPRRMTDFSPQSVDESPYDMESDRLRREIERSLSPERAMEAVHEDKQREQDAIDAPANMEKLHTTGQAPTPEPATSSVAPESHQTREATPPTVVESAPLPPEPQTQLATNHSESASPGGVMSKLTNALEASLDAYAPTAVSSFAHQHLNQPRQSEKPFHPEPPAEAVTKPIESAQPAQSDARSGPGMLDQRFSWETGSKGLFDPDVTGSELPKAYERPRSSGLHVVNTNVSEESDDPEPAAESLGPLHAPSEAAAVSHVTGLHSQHLDTPSAIDLAGGPVSPIASPDMHNERARQLKSGDAPPSPIEGPQLMPDLNSKPLPDPIAQKPLHEQTEARPSSPSAATPTSPGATARIPPFREILALRSAPERISTYNSTRQQFASMDTGLRDWLNTTLSSHPEHAHLAADTTLKPSATLGSVRHKHSPSIIKIAKQLGSSNRDSSATEAVDSPMPAAQRRSSTAMRSVSGSTIPQQGGGVDKMQAKGKDLLHSAGLLGGKATVGAKGLFAKGKQRFGQSRGDKVD
ncbi:hypothetical protein H2203_005504 [Taxawa tesnikishii (nom. ined.)]|nr:hypothetical protein H2203_005504 [Dothideales sp. JES 119]